MQFLSWRIHQQITKETNLGAKIMQASLKNCYPLVFKSIHQNAMFKGTPYYSPGLSVEKYSSKCKKKETFWLYYNFFMYQITGQYLINNKFKHIECITDDRFVNDVVLFWIKITSNEPNRKIINLLIIWWLSFFFSPAPIDAPVITNLISPSATTILVEWSGVQFPAGPIVGHDLNIESSTLVRMSVGHNVFSHVFTDQLPNTTYNVSVAARNSFGSGPLRAQSVTTLEAKSGDFKLGSLFNSFAFLSCVF